MADLGEVGVLHKQPAASIGFEVSGVVVDRLGAPGERTVTVLGRPPSPVIERTINSTGGEFMVYVPDTAPRTVLIYDSEASGQNAIVFDRVIPV